jgi:hypothetical protein
MLLKWVAMGVVFAPRTYFRSGKYHHHRA